MLGVAAFYLAFFGVQPANAAGLIRDAEIESVVKDYARPILNAAGLSSQGIKVHVVDDKSFNAFVVDGNNMFVNIGIFMLSETPNQVIGVIAHEAGHISGGHLASLREVIARARSASLMAQIIGIAAIAGGAIAGGSGDIGSAGTAVMMGGQSMMQRTVLAYRQGHEYAADQAAITFLDATKQSASGMLKVFEYFAKQELGSNRGANPYMQTHPLAPQRLQQTRDLAKASPYFDKRDPEELQARHNMVRAKLSGFRDEPRIVFNKYPRTDQSLPARYARAIAIKMQSGVQAFLPEIDALIAADPDNPYLHEVKGQFLFEAGRAREAVPPLRQAVKLLPKSGLVRILLAQAVLASDETAKTADEAIALIKQALVEEDTYALGYDQLAKAYFRKGLHAEAELASAQAKFYAGRINEAKVFAERAKMKLSMGSPSWVKADDIANFQMPR